MPETVVQRKKSKGLSGGGGKGKSKGNGVVQSVLDLQQQIGNGQTVKTVLGPDVPAQFKAMAGKGKGGPLFFTTSTYKAVSKLLGEYAAKQTSKPSAWRRSKVATLEGLLDDWFAKKGTTAKTDADKAKQAAMKWLQPKVNQERGALNGAKTQEQQTENQAPPEEAKSEPEAEQQSWTKGVKPGGEQSAPSLGKRGWKRGKAGGERGGLLLGGGRTKKQPEPQAKVETPPIEETKQTEVKKTDYTEPFFLNDDASDVSVVSEDEVKVDAPKDPEAKKSDYTKNIALQDLEDASSLESPSIVSNNGGEQDSKPSQSISITSSETQEHKGAPVVEESPKEDAKAEEAVSNLPPPKYAAYRPLDTLYQQEFKKGGKHLVDIYKEGIKYGPDKENIAKALESSWARWKKPTFDKYWDKIVAIFGSQPSMASSEYESMKVSSVGSQDTDGDTLSTSAQEARLTDKKIEKVKLIKKLAVLKIDWQRLEVSAVPQKDKKGRVRSQSEMDFLLERKKLLKAEELAKEKTDPDAVKVKKKLTDEERAKYRLQLGATIVRGPEKAPLDTSGMVSNASGSGFGIFVMSQNGEAYVGSHKVGIFHHSSFLGGGNVAAAGEMKAGGGKLEVLSNKSGHYKPSHAHNMQMIAELKSANIAPSSYKFRYFPPDNTPPKLFATAEEYIDSQPDERDVLPNLKKGRY